MYNKSVSDKYRKMSFYISFEGSFRLKADNISLNKIPAGEGLVLVPADRIEPVTVVCDMCGHQNPEGKELCEKCSNYMKG